MLGQNFTDAKYLIGRPMSVTNLAPASMEQRQLVQQRVDWWHSFDPDNTDPIPTDPIPTDLVTGSGVDPYISPAAAEYQIARIAKARNIPEDQVCTIIRENTRGRFLGFIGEPAVNVLLVNLALDGVKYS